MNLINRRDASDNRARVLVSHEGDLAIEAVVFDLDGTLVDSASDLIEGVRRTFRQLSIGELPASYCPEQLHGTMQGIMHKACEDMGWNQTHDWDVVLSHFIPIYLAMQAPTAELYAGVTPLIQGFLSQGVKLGVCTNSTEQSARHTLKKLGLLEAMSFICGADTFGIAKPSPEPLFGVLKALGVAPEQCLYVGDTEIDAQCAQAAQVRFAWHTGGFGGDLAKNYPHVVSFSEWAALHQYCLK